MLNVTRICDSESLPFSGSLSWMRDNCDKNGLRSTLIRDHMQVMTFSPRCTYRCNPSYQSGGRRYVYLKYLSSRLKGLCSDSLQDMSEILPEIEGVQNRPPIEPRLLYVQREIIVTQNPENDWSAYQILQVLRRYLINYLFVASRMATVRYTNSQPLPSLRCPPWAYLNYL